MNAVRPSFASSLANRPPNWSASRRGSRRGRPAARRSSRAFAAASASGLFDASRRAVSSALSSTGSCTPLTRPRASASSASTTRPVRISSFAKPRPHSAREPLRPAPAGDDPEVDLRLAELRARRRVADVARERELAAAAEREAVDRGDRRLGHRLEQLRDLVAEPPHAFACLDVHRAHRLDVGAGDERAVAGAGEHDGAHARRRRAARASRSRSSVSVATSSAFIASGRSTYDGRDGAFALDADHAGTRARRKSTISHRRRAGREHLGDALALQLRGVLGRDRAADDDEHVLGAVLAQAVEDLRHERHVRAGEDRDADGVGVLLHRRLDDLLGRLVQAGVDHLHAGVAERAGDDLRAAIVSVETGLRDDDSDLPRHEAETTALQAALGAVAPFDRAVACATC